MQRDDVTLVQETLSGNKEAFEQLIRLYSPRVFHIIYLFFHDKMAVEDIAQDVFIKAYTSLPSYSQKRPFKNWLSAIAVHACYRQLQKKKSMTFPVKPPNLK